MASKKEHFHTREEFDSEGITPFLEHAVQYMMDKRSIPIARSELCPVEFTFSNELLEQFVNNPTLLQKPYEVAIKYGFRGYSRGERNGIFRQRRDDVLMSMRTSDFMLVTRSEICEFFDTQVEKVLDLKKVKIVHHAPDGKRIVGVYDKRQPDKDGLLGKILFLGYATY